MRTGKKLPQTGFLAIFLPLLSVFIFAFFQLSTDLPTHSLIYSLVPSPISSALAKTKTSKLKKLNSAASFDPIYSPDKKYIVYGVSNNDGTQGKLYRKKASSKSKGSPLTDDNAANPAYSPDGSYIVYVNLSKESQLYRKNADEKSDGSRINPVSSLDPAYSPNGKYIVYSNSEDEGKLYRINLEDDDNSYEGRKINSVTSHNAVYTSGGNYIYYINVNDGKLYKKKADDDENGEVVEGIKPFSFTLSPDDKYIVYSNVNDNGLLYKRAVSKSGAGKKIGNHTANEPSYLSSGKKVVFSNGDKNLFLYSLKIR
ncbi:MAG: hypothetical protein FJZ04_00720 [Candidatus Moranbacteria bacterium]|nr:hypothetical protein [Candidatus Moranbacteria bacterium]